MARVGDSLRQRQESRMTLEHLNPHGTPRFYTHVVLAEGTKLGFISGQVSMKDGAIVGVGDFAVQTETAFQNFHSCLEAAGATMANVAKMSILVVGLRPELRPVLHAAYEEHLPATNPPAQTTIGVEALGHPDFMIEIEAMLVL
jgi:enamine deaminase RidA (YjgF/YER057c/UK114 family)